MAYCLLVKDKLLHVICRLQSLLKGQLQNLKALPVPEVLELQDISVDLVTSLQLVDKLNGRYDTAKILFGLKLKLGDSGIITSIGVASRCWGQPTVPSDVAKTLGTQWKGFQVSLTQSLKRVNSLPSRFSALSESIELTITYLQREMDDGDGARWCDYVISLGMLPKVLQNEELDIKLPRWFSQDSFKSIIATIKKSKKTVNIEQEGNKEPKVPKYLPDLLVEQEGKLVTITSLISKVEISGSGRVARDDAAGHSYKNRASDNHSGQQFANIYGNSTSHGSPTISY